MAHQRIDIDLGFYQSPSLPFSAQDCLGLYPVASQGEGSSSRGALFSFPGTSKFIQLAGTIALWGMHEFQGELFAVTKSALFKVNSAGISTNLGSIVAVTGTERAIMDDNGETLCIVIPGEASYFYDTTNGLVQITDPIFQDFEAEAGGVTSVVEVDGYFLFSTDISIFQSSLVTVNQGQNFDALAFLSPFLKEDMIRVGKARGQLMAIGESTIKVYRNIATEPFAFQEVKGATIEKGIAFRGGWIEFDNTFFFWGGGKNEKNAAWRGTGSGSVTKISTDAVDAYWRDATYASNGSHAFSWDGQLFIGFVNPPRPMLYNITASALKGHPVWFRSNYTTLVSPVKVYDKIMFAEGQGLIGSLDADLNSQFDGAIANPCLFAGRYLEGHGDNLSVGEIELLVEAGLAQDTWDDPDSSNPQVLLEYSKDEGRTWTTKGSKPTGKSGKYNTNVKWWRMGRFDDRAIFRFSTETKNRQAYTGMKITLEEGY